MIFPAPPRVPAGSRPGVRAPNAAQRSPRLTGSRIAGLGVALALAAGLVACSDIDPPVVTVAGMRLVPIDPTLGLQTLDGDRLQVMEWVFESAVVTVGDETADLVAGASCDIEDNAIASPGSMAPCGDGVVVGSRTDPAPGTITARFTMSVTRAVPFAGGGDFDNDGKPDDTDLCPLQADDPPPDDDVDPMDGIGDACDTINPLNVDERLPDADLDLIPDTLDNCVHIANTDQLDPEFDGIGDACNEETATVSASGGTTIEVTAAIPPFDQPENVVRFIVLDFTNATTLTCDWGAGTCTLDPGSVVACTTTTGADVLAGCD